MCKAFNSEGKLCSFFLISQCITFYMVALTCIVRFIQFLTVEFFKLLEFYYRKCLQ
jgi:hypothetical protein